MIKKRKQKTMVHSNRRPNKRPHFWSPGQKKDGKPMCDDMVTTNLLGKWRKNVIMCEMVFKRQQVRINEEKAKGNPLLRAERKAASKP